MLEREQHTRKQGEKFLGEAGSHDLKKVQAGPAKEVSDPHNGREGVLFLAPGYEVINNKLRKK